MNWKAKVNNKNTEWHIVFAWKPVKTEDNQMVWLERVYIRYKIHMSSGEYVYKLIEKV